MHVAVDINLWFAHPERTVDGLHEGGKRWPGSTWQRSSSGSA